MKHPVTASPAADQKAGLESGEKIVRIGCGAGFATDRIDPAVDLANRGQLDYLFFEGLAERTLAHSYLARQQNPAAGFNPTLERRIAAVLPGCHENGTRIRTNMGAANREAAGYAIAAQSVLTDRSLIKPVIKVIEP